MPKPIFIESEWISHGLNYIRFTDGGIVGWTSTASKMSETDWIVEVYWTPGHALMGPRSKSYALRNDSVNFDSRRARVVSMYIERKQFNG